MFNEKLKGLKEWYARFRGRKFYSRVRRVYTRSKKINLTNKLKREIHDSFNGGR